MVFETFFLSITTLSNYKSKRKSIALHYLHLCFRYELDLLLQGAQCLCVGEIEKNRDRRVREKSHANLPKGST